MKQITAAHVMCLIVGGVVVFGGMMLRPVEPLKAATNDRNSKFAMATCPIDDLGQQEAVFILDFLNGRLIGGVLNNQTKRFSHAYERNLAQDFQVDANDPNPEYAIVCAKNNLQGNQIARGVIHVAEKSSGMVQAYGFQYQNARGNQVLRLQLQPIANFRFREASK